MFIRYARAGIAAGAVFSDVSAAPGPVVDETRGATATSLITLNMDHNVPCRRRFSSLLAPLFHGDMVERNSYKPLQWTDALHQEYVALLILQRI